MKIDMNNRYLTINIISNIVAFMISFGINFFLSPYIVENLGSESYAFVKLAGDFISYISLASVALNSMARRFISIDFMQDNVEGANKYYTTVFVSNIVLGIVVSVLSVVVITNLEYCINVPPELNADVKITFFLVVINFIFSIVFSVYGIGIFVRNKLYLESFRMIESGMMRVVILIGLFGVFKPKIYYIPLTTVFITIYTGLFNLYYTKRLTPQLKLQSKSFEFKKLKVLLSSGIWNVITQLSVILNQGLDLLISNLFIGAPAMGVLAISKTIPNVITSIFCSLSGVYMPGMTNSYAKGKYDDVQTETLNSVKFLGIIINIPIAWLFVFGTDFYRLWMPTQDAVLLQELSMLAALYIVISGSTASIYNIITIANKVKLNSIVAVAAGILNAVVVYILVKTTNLGVYAVAGVSSVLTILRDLMFSIPYASSCLRMKPWPYYISVIKNVFSCAVLCLLYLLMATVLSVSDFYSLLLSGVCCVVVGVSFNLLFVLNKSERAKIRAKIRGITIRK